MYDVQEAEVIQLKDKLYLVIPEDCGKNPNLFITELSRVQPENYDTVYNKYLDSKYSD